MEEVAEEELEVPSWQELAPPKGPDGVRASEFRRRVVAKEPVSGLAFTKLVATKKLEQGDDRELRVIAGASTVDLEKDTVSVAGTNLKFFRTNPILVPNHDTEALPIGVAVKLAKVGDELRATFKFAPKEVNPLADSFFQNHLWRMSVKALGDSGAMFSIFAQPEGENAFEFNQQRGGIDFKRQLLLHVGDVSIGAQQRAQVLAAKSAGVPMEPVLEWALQICKADRSLLVIDRERADLIVKALDPLKGLEVFEMAAGAPEEEEAEPVVVEPKDEVLEALKGLSRRLEAIEKGPKPAPESDPGPAPEISPAPAEPNADEIADQIFKQVADGLIQVGVQI